MDDWMNNDNAYSVSQSEWSAEFQFRASGPERAGGILQLWYTKDGRARIGTSSIYTVGQFDGFALVVDTHGGRVRISPYRRIEHQLISSTGW